MAVPKQRQSNSQSKMRTIHWRRKALDASRIALSLGKSLTTRKAKGFYYPPAPLDTDEKRQGFASTNESNAYTE